MRTAEEERASLNESITVRQGVEGGSHTAGFEAWLRSRGDIKVRLRACHVIALLPNTMTGMRASAHRSSRATRWLTSTG